MPFQLPFGVQVLNPVPVDYYSGPYTASNIQDAINIASASIPSAVRFQSMEVRLIIGGVSKKYWYRDNITDLVEFSSIGSGNSDVFYNIGGTVSATNSTTDIYRTGSINIGTGTASNSRFLVSSSGGTLSLVVNEQGDTIFSGDTKISGQTFSSLPPGSINFGNKTSIYSPGDRQIVIGTDNLSGYNYNYGWKFTNYQITNLWGNPIEVQNTIGTIGNLFVGSNTNVAGYGFGSTQQSTLFVKGTTSSIMKVVGTGATWSNSEPIFGINNNGCVSIGTSGASASLHIKGTVSGNSLLVENSSNTQLLKVLNNGQIILGGNSVNIGGVKGVFIIGEGTADYGSNTSNPNLLTFIVGSTNTTFVSGIQGASLNHGNVRSGIYFTNNASDIVFRAGLQERMRIGVSGNVNINSATAMSGSKLFIASSATNSTIGSNVMLDLYNGQITAVPNQVSELAFSADTAAGVNSYNTQHRYAIISGYATTWNGIVTGGGIKFSTRATTGSSLVTSLVLDPNGGVYNTSRGSNTLYGLNALLVSTGTNNTAIGTSALQNNLGGLNNTAIGYRAGYLISGTTSGATNSSNSVFIGYDTRPQADGQSNQIVIGCTASGNGSNSVTLGNDSITKTILKGNVGIGTASPSTKLHIYATQSGAFQLQDGSEGVGLTLISDEYGFASWTSSTILVTGTFGTLESLVSNNELVIGGSYILLGYQTIYQINGSNTTGIVQLHTVIGETFSYSQFVNVPSEIGGPGNFAGVTVTVASVVPGATLIVGQSLTITTWFSPNYIVFTPNVVGVNVGCTLKFEKQRYSNVIGGATYSDIYGKPIMKPGGVLNIEVHDGTPYMSMTASENPAVLTEDIVLTAIDTNKFSRDAESLTFPGDKLVYDYTDKYVYDENGNIIANKPGTIIQRTNISGSISMNKDWRVQRYRRYGVDSTNWSRLTLATASIYKIGVNSLCTTTNPSISTNHRYIATDPYIFNFFTDFNKNYTGTSSIFVTGTSSAPSMSDGSRSLHQLSGNEYSNDLNISSFTSSVKDFNIIPIVNGEPTNLIEKCIVNDVSNTIFLPYSQTYGLTFDLNVDSKNGNITNSTFASLPLILNTGTINKLSVIDYMILNNFSTYNQSSTTAGSILNTLMLSYANLSNTGQIVNTTIGGGAGALTAFNNINFSDSTIYNCVIGGHRNNSMEIKLKANKSLICFNVSTLVSITGNSYLTALKNQSTSFYSSTIKLNNFNTLNPNKGLYGYLYDFNLGLSDLELNNNTLDKRLVYQYLDNSNNTISVTASIAR